VATNSIEATLYSNTTKEHAVNAWFLSNVDDQIQIGFATFPDLLLYLLRHDAFIDDLALTGGRECPVKGIFEPNSVALTADGLLRARKHNLVYFLHISWRWRNDLPPKDCDLEGIFRRN